MRRYIVGISGASGPVLALRVLKALSGKAEIHLTASSTALLILREEEGIDWQGQDAKETQSRIRAYVGDENIHFYAEWDFTAPIASGSFQTDGMLVVPCSMKTLSGIANGYANSLLERAADVMIKEHRKLLIVPREMPLSAIHLEHMLKLARLGVIVAPPVPGFYHGPKTLDDSIDFLAGKILDAFGVENNLFKRWGS